MSMESLKILLSAYSCEPGRGSEPGVGWRWALELARLGHEVWVITRDKRREGINRHRAAQAMPANLHFVYYDLPNWAAWWKSGNRGVHLYYVLWQWGAWRRARELHERLGFDAVHHITFGVMRHPSFMARLRIPCVIGPLGGGERAPLALRRHLTPAERLREAARDAANLAARFDPWVRRMLAEAALILAKTPETLQWLGGKYRDKAGCMFEIGVDPAPRGIDVDPPAALDGALRMLYVGRFVQWKGMGLGLRAVARLRARGVDARLTMIGQGPELARWQALSRSLGIAEFVSWVAWMKQDDLLRTYRSFDALLFPSLHDSSGNVVLESFACGLPVVCLALGGPAQLVDDSCGRVVAVAGRTEEQVIDDLAGELEQMSADPVLRAALREGALSRARRYTWPQVVSRVWGPEGCAYRLVAGTTAPRRHPGLQLEGQI